MPIERTASLRMKWMYVAFGSLCWTREDKSSAARKDLAANVRLAESVKAQAMIASVLDNHLIIGYMNNWKKSICSKRSGQSSEETPCFQGSGDLLLVIVASCVQSWY